VRPGRGGFRRRPPGAIDPAAGLGEYGTPIFQSASAGATLGVIELDPNGNTVIVARLSGEDRNERLADQIRPCLSLCARHAETLIPRYLLLSYDMQGRREVPFDRSPTSGEPVRDDILQLNRWIEEGWLEHVLFRDVRRLARDEVIAGQILRHLDRCNVGFWMAEVNRQVDLRGERVIMAILNVLSANDRDHTASKLMLAKLNKGPLVGLGWGPLPFGFYRDRTRAPQQDNAQWKYVLRMFELADQLGAKSQADFSTRKLQKLLAAEGCEFSLAHVAWMLKRRIYVTGEYVANVRGHAIAQTPIELRDPVPMDRFLRVQELLALRRAPSNRTPLGLFILNSVETVHSRCAGQRNRKNKPIRIRGYSLQGVRPDRYRHGGNDLPECCKCGDGRGLRGAFTWDRDALERPIIEAVRELATHPEILRQEAEAAQHLNANSSARLTVEQRLEVKRTIDDLERQLERATDEWIDSYGERGNNADIAGYKRYTARFEQRLASLKRRLEADEAAAAREPEQRERIGDQNRVRAFLEILSVQTPKDPFMRQLRARLFQRIVHRVVVHDEGEGSIEITLEGHLVPADASLEAANPILAAADLLDAYLKGEQNVPSTEATSSETIGLQPVLSVVTDKTGWKHDGRFEGADFLGLPTNAALLRARRADLNHTGWSEGWSNRIRRGRVSWKRVFLIDCPAWDLDKQLLDALASLGGSASRSQLRDRLAWGYEKTRRCTKNLLRDGKLVGERCPDGTQIVSLLAQTLLRDGKLNGRALPGWHADRLLARTENGRDMNQPQHRVRGLDASVESR